MKQVHVFISGFVQGVGFRSFVKNKAEKLELTGWIRNLPDGRVEALFQSSASSDQEAKEDLNEMINICKKGPLVSEVEEVTVKWEDIEQIHGSFKIII